MTLKAIKEQFKPGEQWQCIREEKREQFPPITTATTRTVARAGPTYLTWTVQSTGKKCDTKWPKASEVIEARPDLLKFHYFNGGVVLTFTKEAHP